MHDSPWDEMSGVSEDDLKGVSDKELKEETLEDSVKRMVSEVSSDLELTFDAPTPRKKKSAKMAEPEVPVASTEPVVDVVPDPPKPSSPAPVSSAARRAFLRMNRRA